jgi:hypothetical protein
MADGLVNGLEGFEIVRLEFEIRGDPPCIEIDECLAVGIIKWDDSVHDWICKRSTTLPPHREKSGDEDDT